MSTAEQSLSTTHELAERYGAAWNAHDLEAILADDAVFHLHLEGFEAAEDEEAIRGQFEAFLAALPDMHFATKRLHACEGLFVHGLRFTATLARPFPVIGQMVECNGQRIDVDGVDVIPCPGGRVKRKDTYFDGIGFGRQLLGE